eukprot:gene6807-381_t
MPSWRRERGGGRGAVKYHSNKPQRGTARGSSKSHSASQKPKHHVVPNQPVMAAPDHEYVSKDESCLHFHDIVKSDVGNQSLVEGTSSSVPVDLMSSEAILFAASQLEHPLLHVKPEDFDRIADLPLDVIAKMDSSMITEDLKYALQNSTTKKVANSSLVRESEVIPTFPTDNHHHELGHSPTQESTDTKETEDSDEEKLEDWLDSVL